MTAARVQLEPAYLLSLRPYRETSALLEIFTAAHGRVGLVAKAVRAPKSRQRGLLQAFQRLLLSWTERGDLGTLTGAEADGPPAALAGESIFSGWYVNELLLRLLQRHDPHPQLFHIYEQTLQQLASAFPSPPAGGGPDTASRSVGAGGAAPARAPAPTVPGAVSRVQGGTQGRARGGVPSAEPAIRLFELHLLAELGYGLQLPDTLQPTNLYRYDFERGPTPSATPSSETYSGASLLALAQGRLQDPEALRDAKRLLRAALARHLGGRPLETPRLLRALRRRQTESDA